MQNKFTGLLVFTFLFSTVALGQSGKAVLTFSEIVYDFGTIRETEGTIDHAFNFVNQGKVPLIINDVNSSCGCTVPSWPHEPVLPGQKGTIRVNFNPDNQSGAINKTIEVLSNAETARMVLTLKGVVIPAEKVEEVYRFTIGELRLQTIYAALGEIYKGKTALYSIKVFNNSNLVPATLSFKKIPPHLKITIDPELLEPQQEGTITFEYLTSEVNTWDYTVDRLELLVNGKELSGSNRISVTANIKEDFSRLTAEQMADAPKAEFDNPSFDFGKISPDKVVEHVFRLTNSGKSNLLIRKVSASCGCTAVQPAKTIILPGETTEIKAIFNARGRDGNQKKAITVITNDPKKSRTILWISGVVENPAVKNSDQ